MPNALADQLLIYGAGGHAKSVLAVIERMGGWRIAGLIEDGAADCEKNVLGHPILGNREALPALLDAGLRHATVAIGDNAGRLQIAELLETMGFSFPVVAHPGAVILNLARIGDGTFIHALAVIGPEAAIGRHAIVSATCTVGHDSRIGDFAHLAPGARIGGHAVVGDHAFIGMGAVILPRVRVGRHATVAANSVVNDDLEDGAVAAGIPARVIRHNPFPA